MQEHSAGVTASVSTLHTTQHGQVGAWSKGDAATTTKLQRVGAFQTKTLATEAKYDDEAASLMATLLSQHMAIVSSSDHGIVRISEDIKSVAQVLVSAPAS
jgi:hypothetical protein